MRRRRPGRRADPASAGLTRLAAGRPSPTSSREPVRYDPRAVARLISLVEDQSPALAEVAAALAPYTGNAHVIGLTGAPVLASRRRRRRWWSRIGRKGDGVGVLAVDPSSPFTGGALLGDRVRMQEHAARRRSVHPVDGDPRPPRRPCGGCAAGRSRPRRRGV